VACGCVGALLGRRLSKRGRPIKPGISPAAPITSLREYPYRLSAYKSSGIESFSKRSAIFLKRGPVRGMRANGPKLIESVVSRPIGATHK
jgi:hypothetical protein